MVHIIILLELGACLAGLQEHKKDNLSECKSSGRSPSTASMSPETSISVPNHSTSSDESREGAVKIASRSKYCYGSHPNRNSNLLPSDDRKKARPASTPQSKWFPFGKVLTSQWYGMGWGASVDVLTQPVVNRESSVECRV